MPTLTTLLARVAGECLAATQTLADAMAGYADAAVDRATSAAIVQAGAVVDELAGDLESLGPRLGVAAAAVRSAAIDGVLDDVEALVRDLDDPGTATTALVGALEAAVVFVRARFLAALCHADRLEHPAATLLREGAHRLDVAAEILSIEADRCLRTAAT